MRFWKTRLSTNETQDKKKKEKKKTKAGHRSDLMPNTENHSDNYKKGTATNVYSYIISHVLLPMYIPTSSLMYSYQCIFLHHLSCTATNVHSYIISMVQLPMCILTSSLSYYVPNTVLLTNMYCPSEDKIYIHMYISLLGQICTCPS